MSAHTDGVRGTPTWEPEVEVIDGELRDIELRITADDPAFARRFRRLERAERANTIIVVVLLITAAISLAGGLATYSWYALVAGAVAFVSAFAVDRRYRRRWARHHRLDVCS